MNGKGSAEVVEMQKSCRGSTHLSRNASQARTHLRLAIAELFSKQLVSGETPKPTRETRGALIPFVNAPRESPPFRELKWQ